MRSVARIEGSRISRRNRQGYLEIAESAIERMRKKKRPLNIEDAWISFEEKFVGVPRNHGAMASRGNGEGWG